MSVFDDQVIRMLNGTRSGKKQTRSRALPGPGAFADEDAKDA